jgi:hypothetical protein
MPRTIKAATRKPKPTRYVVFRSMLYRELLMPNRKQHIKPTPENDAMKALAARRTIPTITNLILILGGVPVPPFLNPNLK